MSYVSRWLVVCSFALVVVSCGPTGNQADGGCPAGTEGCACAAGDRCATSTQGDPLVCTAGVCEAMHCSVGDPGCACRRGQCNDPANTCTDGFCISKGCLPGQANCSCLAGGCDPSLTCLEGTVCVDSAGYEGGACLGNGRCYRGNRCDSASGLCVFCDPGSAACACNANNACSGGLACIGGLCLSAQQLPPANPRCYTPCRASIDDGGTCNSDGLINGCLDGQTCLQGSCIEPNQTKPSCAGDLDCPFFQVCLSGGCYSNCDVNADCPTGMGCAQHACRQTCLVANNTTCPTGTACTADDGFSGFCTPVGHSATPAAPSPTGGLTVPRSAVYLSNVKPSDGFMLVPASSSVQDITVRKLWHESTNAAGVTERVDAPLDATGHFRTCNPVMNECPLSWLKLKAPGGMAEQSPTIAFRLLPGCVDPDASPDAGAPCPTIGVEGAGDTSAVKWQGELEVASGDARTRIYLSYVQRPDGQWSGSMYYFGAFSNQGLAPWIANSNKSNVTNVNNGLLQRWGALRSGTGALQSWGEFVAVLTATTEGSWKFPNVAQLCSTLGTGGACYPFSNMLGVRSYVQNTVQFPIPEGVTALPVAMNLKLNPNTPELFEGRMVSSTAMHYPGNPAVKLQFTANPALPASCATMGGSSSDCLIYLKDLNAVGADVNRLVSTVGGRYPSSNGTCSAGYKPTEVPWLVPGFLDGTTDGGVSKIECRDNELPFDNSAPGNAALNQSLAGGNPVPDGNPRQRTLRFLDGVLVNQTELFILFEETYASFIPNQAPTTAYGFMRLKRAAAKLEAADYVGLVGPTSTVKTPPVAPGAQCDARLMTDLFPLGVPADKRLILGALLNGTTSTTGYTSVPGNAGINYWCEDTGLFNGGSRDNGSPTAAKVACPAGSKVLFFNVGTSRTVADMASEACQTTYVPEPEGRSCTSANQCRSGLCSSGKCVRATCYDTLKGWKASGTVVTEGGSDSEPLVNQCNQPNDVYCDANRLDLRANKQFYARSVGNTARAFVPLPLLVETAFRYKTRFRSSVSGSALGFAPVRCQPNSDAVPYCYDPVQIEEARKRVDCLLTLHADTAFTGTLTGGQDLVLRTQLFTFLQQNFSQLPNNREGFERLYAELMTMQGDDALTSAYASRFDLAAAGGASFRGSTFEPNGIDLTGVAGAEMYDLYQAVEYYQLALDRLYALGPNFQSSLAATGDANFVTPATVTSYLDRLVRAASQKSRAWAEIGRRYQGFNRPDLARRIVERAYVSTYLESALISRLMLDIAERTAQSSLPQLRTSLDNTQRNFRLSMTDMREVYQQFADQLDQFGYPAGYVPFPALDSSSVSSGNAYEQVSLIVKQRVDLAKNRELTALTFGKQGKVDAAQFQSDLTSIRNNYENQLSSICGTFTADDRRVYPAIRKYAPLGVVTTLLADPCGRVGNGDLHDAMSGVQDSVLKLQGVLLRHENQLKEIDIERGRAAQQCGITMTLANYQYKVAGQTYDMQQAIDEERATMNFANGVAQGAISALLAANCEGPGCVKAAIAGVTAVAISAAAAGAQFGVDLDIASKERTLKDFDRNSVKAATLAQCSATQVDSTARIAGLFNETLETQIEALRAEYGVRQAMAEVQRLANNAQRLQAQQEEAEQLTIDVQAAQNDPSVRIYQNDAVINADVSFNAALSAAYRLTRVYEYYTSQSYAKKEQLYVIRMVSAGQYNLENYLLELDNEFNAFEEQFGNPDVRVLALSLKDDILQIPYLKTDRTPYTENERIALMREKLRDVRLLDRNGYLTLPFSTSLSSVSPVTRNHKIRHVEIDLQGVRLGDAVARVYLRMSGTGVVRDVADNIDSFVFPSRLGVVNASLLGSKVYDPEVYRNYRFRDRPLVNTMWELVINQRDEVANQDVDLQTLTDLRVLFYYSDFTSF